MDDEEEEDEAEEKGVEELAALAFVDADVE